MIFFVVMVMLMIYVMLLHYASDIGCCWMRDALGGWRRAAAEAVLEASR